MFRLYGKLCQMNKVWWKLGIVRVKTIFIYFLPHIFSEIILIIVIRDSKFCFTMALNGWVFLVVKLRQEVPASSILFHSYRESGRTYLFPFPQVRSYLSNSKLVAPLRGMIVSPTGLYEELCYFTKKDQLRIFDAVERFFFRGNHFACPESTEKIKKSNC